MATTHRETWLHELRHDINGPLGTVRSVITLCREGLDTRDPEQIRDYLLRAEEHITSVQRRLEELVKTAP